MTGKTCEEPEDSARQVFRAGDWKSTNFVCQVPPAKKTPSEMNENGNKK
jgi:hypothetical protein